MSRMWHTSHSTKSTIPKLQEALLKWKWSRWEDLSEVKAIIITIHKNWMCKMYAYSVFTLSLFSEMPHRQVEVCQKCLWFQMGSACSDQVHAQNPRTPRATSFQNHTQKKMCQGTDSHGRVKKDPPHPFSTTSQTSSNWLSMLYVSRAWHIN